MSHNLIAHNVPLFGKHLIEASAGTGKTYNITRIYLRLLLERKLPVEKILVMTFTKDATQELKGRIDSTIREALNHWTSLVETDDFYQAIAARVPEQEALFLLKKALLFLDESAIYTIHGFCQRVLNEHAFGTKTSFDACLESDLSDIVEQACQDWYRSLAVNSSENFLLLAEFWQTPAHFLSSFAKAIYQTSILDVLTVEDITATFQQQIQSALESLKNQQTLIYQGLIDNQKAANQTVRITEYNELIQWLSELLLAPQQNFGKMPTSFYNGTRYAKSALKQELLAVFEPVKDVRTSYEGFAKSIAQAKAFELVRAGIYQIRLTIKKQKQQLNVLGFDDLISNLAEALTANATLAKRIQQDFPVALVDEFQDTDPAQFTILNALYPQEATTEINEQLASEPALFMIGDPKQAIYGFRGGDVFAYLAAKEHCQQQWLMDTNWRSSKHMIAGYNRLFYGAELGAERGGELTQNTDVFGYQIPYLPVKASPKAKAELAANDNYQALQFIHFDTDNTDKAVPQSFRATMAVWCANEIERLLNIGIDKASVQLKAQDIAILVRDGTEAKEIKLALEQLGLSSVYLSNRSDLFETAQSKQLLILLKGILYCDNDRLFSAALISPLLGYHPAAFYQLQQNEFAWQTLKFTFEELRKHWTQKSFMSMALKLMHEHFSINGNEQDRVLTNVLHLFELLQIASQRHRQPHELIFWLEQHVNGQTDLTETELRLDSDDDIIKIVTQHGSKGLEYPVVFIPFASRYKHPLKLGNKNIHLIEYHDQAKKLHISLDGSEHAKSLMVAENQAETIRLLYVAITRAEQRCYVLTTDFDNAHLSPIGATLHLSKEVSLQQQLQCLAQAEGIGLATITVDNIANAALSNADVATKIDRTKSAKAKPTITVASFTSKIERDWWLSSFSALTRHTSHQGISTPDRDQNMQTDGQDVAHEVIEQLREQESYLMRFRIAKGAQTGNFLHDVFEVLDFAKPNWQESLKKAMIKYHYLLDGFSEKEFIDWLTDILNTPLPAILSANIDSKKYDSKKYDSEDDKDDIASVSLTLASLTKHKTLREAEFYFPMENASMSGLVNLLSDHRNNNYRSNKNTQNQHGRVNDSTAQINLPLYRKLKGMMHGFIDLIFEANGKFYLCDYKSSHLGDDFSAYQFDKLQQHIEANYYDLQYLIYSLALHRYLQGQLADYEPNKHFGGVYYLYLRGMTAQNSKQTGVYFNPLSVEQLNNLDIFFAQQVGVKHG